MKTSKIFPTFFLLAVTTGIYADDNWLDINNGLEDVNTTLANISINNTNTNTNGCSQEHSTAFLAQCRCHGIDRVRLENGEKVVALTFDDGPHRKYTAKVVDILAKNGIEGTFFVIGENVKRYPGIVQLAYNNGNVIGNHSYSHPHLPNLSEEGIADELTKTNDIIYDTIHVHPTLFRPPYGACSEEMNKVAENLSLKEIVWNDMVADYEVKETTPEKITAGIIAKAKPGGIIGMHDGGGNRAKTVAALPLIINGLKKEGYSFVTVPELLTMGQPS